MKSNLKVLFVRHVNLKGFMCIFSGTVLDIFKVSWGYFANIPSKMESDLYKTRVFLDGPEG